MVEIKRYDLPATALIPNSPRPLLHYRGVLPESSDIKLAAYDCLVKNGWVVQWMTRYGQTQASHYHTSTHECMVVLSGRAIIRFGVADTVSDLDENTYGSGREEGGVEIEATTGDVFIIPAGVAHKTYNAQPAEDFKILTPGDAHRIVASDTRSSVAQTDPSGFTMMGAYPAGREWDYAFGGENSYGGSPNRTRTLFWVSLRMV